MSAELDVTFLGWTKMHRARERVCSSTPTVPETVKSKQGGFSFSRHFAFPRLCLLAAAVDLLIYFELFQALMCGVTFSCFDAGGRM